MKLIDIIARKDGICFVLDEAFTGTLVLTEEAPVIHGENVLLDKQTIAFEGGKASVSRLAGEHDRAFGRYYLYAGEEKIDGVCYITEIEDAACCEPYPTLKTIKSLNTRYEIAAPLGCDQQGRPDINLPAFISLREQPGTFPYRFEGRTYYIFEDAVESLNAE